MSIFTPIYERVMNEPAMTLALVQAVIAMAIGYGLQMTPEQMGVSLAFTAAFLGWLTRSQVTPVRGLA